MSNDARLWEIAENLHRAELTALERDEHIAEWIAIINRQPSQGGKAVLSDGRKSGPQHQPSGINRARIELGLKNNEANRAIKIANLSPEAKAVAKEVGLDDNQSALLKAAKSPTPDMEVANLRAEAARRKVEHDRKELEKTNKHINRVIEMTAEEEFAEWLESHHNYNMAMVISWIEGTKPKGIIAALRRAYFLSRIR